MITRLDDFPIHQSAAPVTRAASGDRNHYDRYFFNGYGIDEDGGPSGETFFAAAMGRYPNRGILDAAFSVVVDGTQHSLHASGRAPLDPIDTRCGPVQVEVVEPLQELRLRVDGAQTGIGADLTWRSRTVAIEEPPFFRRAGNRVVMDYTRSTQFGSWSGWIEVAGRRLTLDAQRTMGCRDRSWGVRTVGEPEPGGAPSTELPQFFWLWAPINFGDRCVHFDVNETADGSRWHSSGFVVPVLAAGDDVVDPGGTERSAEAASSVDWSIDWRSGSRRADAASLTFVRPGGDRIELELEPVLDFQMLGLGYFHPRFSHGVWVGEDAVETESWRLDELDATALHHLHVQQLVRVRSGDGFGAGVLEQLVIGPHQPSGLNGLADPA